MQEVVTKLLLTVEEAAERLNISRTRMYALVASEQVFSVKLGRVRRVPVTALEHFLAELEAQEWHGEAGTKAVSLNAAMGAGKRVSLFPANGNPSTAKPARK